MPDLEFIGEWSVASGLTLAGFLGLLAGVVYLRETWKHHTWLRWGLPLMRAAAVFLLVMVRRPPTCRFEVARGVSGKGGFVNLF